MFRKCSVGLAYLVALAGFVTITSCDQAGNGRSTAPALDEIERLAPVLTRSEGRYPKSRSIVSVPSQSAAVIDEDLAQANNRFGFKLFAELVGEKPDENIFISPSSVALALMMTVNGASGETRRAMEQTLELSGMTREEMNAAALTLIRAMEAGDPKVEVAIANSLWADDDVEFKADFFERCRKSYDAEIQSLDLQADGVADLINGWVSDKTRETIKEVIQPPINPLTILFLINAIYFKGTWTYEFDPEKTENGDFHGVSGATEILPFMQQKNEFDYLDGEGFSAVRLPYGEKCFSMILFLPDKGVGLSAFQATITPAQWKLWMSEFQSDTGTVQLPRFMLEYKAVLNDPLSNLGMGIAFSDLADFSDMVQAWVKISSVTHKSFLKVNEEGTEASAVTVVDIELVNEQPNPPFHLRFDRPFFCAIVDDESGAVLFMGAIYDPEEIED